MKESLWHCEKCRKPEVKKTKDYIAIGCTHYAVVRWASGEGMLVGSTVDKVNAYEVIIEAVK